MNEKLREFVQDIQDCSICPYTDNCEIGVEYEENKTR